MTRWYHRVYEKLKENLPPQLAAFCDYILRPKLRECYGGGFNGQHKRQEFVKELLQKISFNAIVETGTFRGETTEFFATQVNIPIFSCEIVPLHYHYSKYRLKNLRNVSLFLSNSVDFLKCLAENSMVSKERVFFYLDAHGYKDLPLRDEINTIVEIWSNSMIMVDDFQVPDDSGYGYDNYGPVKELTLNYLNFLRIESFEFFFPSTPSFLESGRKRGCILLVQKGPMVESMNRIPLLKIFQNYKAPRTTSPSKAL